VISSPPVSPYQKDDSMYRAERRYQLQIVHSQKFHSVHRLGCTVTRISTFILSLIFNMHILKIEFFKDMKLCHWLLPTTCRTVLLPKLRKLIQQHSETTATDSVSNLHLCYENIKPAICLTAKAIQGRMKRETSLMLESLDKDLNVGHG